MEDMINKNLEVYSVAFPYRAPKELIAASKTAEELERSLYSAYRGWREIPQTDVRIGQQPTYPF